MTVAPLVGQGLTLVSQGSWPRPTNDYFYVEHLDLADLHPSLSNLISKGIPDWVELFREPDMTLLSFQDIKFKPTGKYTRRL